jgi:hypothetical protein
VQPPFPGMDPYLEQPSMWPDVHHRLITAICDQIQSQIVPRYVAVITPYVAFESLEIAPVRLAVPDVGVYERDIPGTLGAAVPLAPAPLVVKAEMEVPTRYARIELRTVGDETLVTAIEVLSPANKRPGVDGADGYEKKRQELFRSEAHLLEIDLLRAGRRPRLTKALPDAPYFIFLSRAERRPHIEIWPLSLRAAIPLVPVPLRYPDHDVPLDLGKVLHQIYTNARYDVQVDYRGAPPAPDLAPDDAAWLDAHLRERGLRS